MLLALFFFKYSTEYFPRCRSGKESICPCRRCKRLGFDPWVGKIPWGRKWQPTPVFLPGKSHGHRSLVGYSPWGCKESDTTERLHFPLSFPRKTWWSTVHGVTKSQTQLDNWARTHLEQIKQFFKWKNNRSSVISRNKTQLKLIQALKKKLLHGDHFELMTRKVPRFS